MSPFKRFWLKLVQWEYWPFYIFYIPVEAYYLWLALKNGRFAFLTSANPSMEFGGFTGVSKTSIYELIPSEYLPKMKLIAPGDWEAARKAVEWIGYPVVAKPDMGERGKLVEKISNELELEKYVINCPVDFILQEVIRQPLELGIFYLRHPEEECGHITSIVQKDFMSVTGDGAHTVQELLQKDERALLQIDFEHPRFEEVMKEVPEKGEKKVVESVGNHCRGTVFLDRCDLIDEELTEAIDQLSKRIEGFYYGRFDLRCASAEALKRLEDFKIIELNGAGAEPAHIYQPGYSLIKAYRVVFWHFKQLARISQANHRRGVPQWGFRRAVAKLFEVRRYNKMLSKG
ncbi:hypothetical protein [Marinoscillum sp. MHG1-6]|uniref:hypothetical protein n=1 Tax=Marinoscillum sp. MHG1-6 TaxID=2959627 RepID=UPI0021583DFC|nr:hypothetical protein [Marinoscillum sp. MHG1-6]